MGTTRNKKTHSTQTEGETASTEETEAIEVTAETNTLIRPSDSNEIAGSATSTATKSPNAGRNKTSAETRTTGSTIEEGTKATRTTGNIRHTKTKCPTNNQTSYS